MPSTAQPAATLRCALAYSSPNEARRRVTSASTTVTWASGATGRRSTISLVAARVPSARALLGGESHLSPDGSNPRFDASLAARVEDDDGTDELPDRERSDHVSEGDSPPNSDDATLMSMSMSPKLEVGDDPHRTPERGPGCFLAAHRKLARPFLSPVPRWLQGPSPTRAAAPPRGGGRGLPPPEGDRGLHVAERVQLVKESTPPDRSPPTAATTSYRRGVLRPRTRRRGLQRHRRGPARPLLPFRSAKSPIGRAPGREADA